jgi:hypothetical protein
MKSDATIPEWSTLAYASEAEVKTGSEAAKVVAPSTMIGHEGIIKAWVNFNGNGTAAIKDSFNVSGITDNGTGDYSVAWDTDFGSINYVCAGMCCYFDTRNVPTVVTPYDYATKLVGSYRFQTSQVDNGAAVDSLDVHILAIGDR